MPRTAFRPVLLALVTSAVLVSTACTRSATGPSDEVQPTLENQGADN
jgi:hypothetical protein